MTDIDIKQLWQAYDAKLETSLQLNHKIIRDMLTQKAENKLSAYLRGHLATAVLGILWILFLGFLILHTSSIYFIISAGAILLFNIFAVIAYFRMYDTLESVNITTNIMQAQQKLASVQASLINVGRILVLQAPFYCTFWYSDALVKHAGAQFWTINLAIVGVFIITSVYLFNKLTYKNAHIKWVKAVLESFGGKTLTNAIAFFR
jgi:hypothetical protein